MAHMRDSIVLVQGTVDAAEHKELEKLLEILNLSQYHVEAMQDTLDASAGIHLSLEPSYKTINYIAQEEARKVWSAANRGA